MSNLVLDKYLNNYQVQKKRESENQAKLRAKVDEIIKITGIEKNYDYGYWCKKVKQSQKSFFEVLEICEVAQTLDSKYPKGKFITNRLCNKPTKNQKE